MPRYSSKTQIKNLQKFKTNKLGHVNKNNARQATRTVGFIPSTFVSPMQIGVEMSCAACSLSNAAGKAKFFSKKSLQDFPVATAAICKR